MATVRDATISDMRPVAEVFMGSFPVSVAHYVKAGDPKEALEDLFSLCLVQKGHFLVLEDEGRVAGYVVAPYSMRNLVFSSLVGGGALKIAAKFLSGRYRIGLADALKAAGNAAKNLFGNKKAGTKSDARILSIAVSPRYQGRGYGRILLGAALEALARRGVKAVRLEVRPDNAPAVKLYTWFGFKEEGSFSDSQGEWLVMVKVIE